MFVEIENLCGNERTGRFLTLFLDFYFSFIMSFFLRLCHKNGPSVMVILTHVKEYNFPSLFLSFFFAKQKTKVGLFNNIVILLRTSVRNFSETQFLNIFKNSHINFLGISSQQLPFFEKKLRFLGIKSRACKSQDWVPLSSTPPQFHPPQFHTKNPSVSHTPKFHTKNPSVRHQKPLSSTFPSVSHQKPPSSTHPSVPHQKPLSSTHPSVPH